MKNQNRIRPKVSQPATLPQPQTPATGLKEYIAKEFRLIALRDCPIPNALSICETPPQAVEYWRLHLATHPYFDSERECLAVLILNSRLRLKGHLLVTIGTINTLLIHAREVFRTAIVAGAYAIILMHNHPSGDATPSEADIEATRKMERAGEVVGIDVLDHLIVVGQNPQCPKGYSSLRELGYIPAAPCPEILPTPSQPA
jgi:DNA repair protein RadC